MYTEEDLRATFGAMEREAPDVTDVLAGFTRAQRRRTIRRGVVGVATAAAVAAVVAGGSVLVGNLAGPSETRPAAQPPARHFDRLEFPFAVDESTGLEVDYQYAFFVGASSAVIDTDEDASDRRYAYQVDVFPTGGYVPPSGHAGEPVQVNDKTGFYTPALTYPDNPTAGVPGVAWEYAPDSWAMVRYEPSAPGIEQPADVRETVLRLAAAVRFDQTTPLLLPFKVGHLPDGLYPSQDFPADMSSGPNGIYAGFTLKNGSGWIGFRFVDPVDGPPPVGEPSVQDTDHGTVKVVVNLGPFSVELDGKGYSADELKRIALSITPADPHDESTWIEAKTALPLH